MTDSEKVVKELNMLYTLGIEISKVFKYDDLYVVNCIENKIERVVYIFSKPFELSISILYDKLEGKLYADYTCPDLSMGKMTQSELASKLHYIRMTLTRKLVKAVEEIEKDISGLEKMI